MVIIIVIIIAIILIVVVVVDVATSSTQPSLYAPLTFQVCIKVSEYYQHLSEKHQPERS